MPGFLFILKGSLLGSLSSIPAHSIGASVIKDVLHRANLDGGEVDEVIMGQILTAGIS